MKNIDVYYRIEDRESCLTPSLLDTVSNRGYSPHLSCQPPQVILLNATFFELAVRVEGRQAYKIASR